MTKWDGERSVKEFREGGGIEKVREREGDNERARARGM